MGVLLLATAALAMWFYSIEMNRFSYHAVDYANCKITVFDSKKRIVYALISRDIVDDHILNTTPGKMIWSKIPVDGIAKDVWMQWK
jgi:hypothetical protein